MESTIKNLSSHLVKYNKYDVPLTGNPQITCNCLALVNSNNTYKRHTNYVYGMATLNVNNTSDFISNFIIENTDLIIDLIICIDKN